MITVVLSRSRTLMHKLHRTINTATFWQPTFKSKFKFSQTRALASQQPFSTSSKSESNYTIMPPFKKRKQFLKEIAVERERQRKVRKMREERGWESSEEEEDITAIGLLQPERSAARLMSLVSLRMRRCS